MKKNGRNKRRYDRQQLYYYLKVYHAGSGSLAGYLGDLSAQGLMIFSQIPIETGREMALEIELKKEFDLGPSLVLKTRSMWCEKDANPDFHILGFRFLDICQADLDVIFYLMDKYGFEKT